MKDTDKRKEIEATFKMLDDLFIDDFILDNFIDDFITPTDVL